MTLTPEQLEEAKQLLGVPDHSGGIGADTPKPAADTAESTGTQTETQPEAEAPAVDPAPAVPDNTLSVYCPNCSHLLAKVSNDAN